METRRPTNPAAEELLGLYFPVLDHGFVALVDYMGSDEDVERAARVSYGYGTRRTSETRGLVRYLRRHRHTTPSEMVAVKFHCSMPIFIAGYISLAKARSPVHSNSLPTVRMN